MRLTYVAKSVSAGFGIFRWPGRIQHSRGVDHLRAVGMLRPAHGVDDRPRFLHISVLANRREKIGSPQELVLRNAGDPLDDFRRVARVLLLQQLEDAARMLQIQVVRDIRRKCGRRWRRLGWLGSDGRRNRFMRYLCGDLRTRQIATFFVIPGRFIVRVRRRIEARPNLPGETTLLSPLKGFFASAACPPTSAAITVCLLLPRTLYS